MSETECLTELERRVDALERRMALLPPPIWPLEIPYQPPLDGGAWVMCPLHS